MKRIILYLTTSLICITQTNCATSPTGRSQLMLVSDKQMNEMGAVAFEEMKTKNPRSNDKKINDLVNCVVNPLIKVVGTDNWEVVVFQDEGVNAFALPGQKIGVQTGILKAAKTDSQLAAVIGHEIGHVIAKHGAERVSQALAAEGGLMAVDAFILGRSKTREQKALIMAALGLGLQFGIVLPHGRKQESEADIVGLQLMADAGFDPRESVNLWKNMSELSGSEPPEWLSTHPSNQRRIRDLEQNLNEVLPKFEQARAAGRHPKCQ